MNKFPENLMKLAFTNKPNQTVNFNTEALWQQNQNKWKENFKKILLIK